MQVCQLVLAAGRQKEFGEPCRESHEGYIGRCSCLRASRLMLNLRCCGTFCQTEAVCVQVLCVLDEKHFSSACGSVVAAVHSGRPDRSEQRPYVLHIKFVQGSGTLLVVPYTLHHSTMGYSLSCLRCIRHSALKPDSD